MQKNLTAISKLTSWGLVASSLTGWLTATSTSIGDPPMPASATLAATGLLHSKSDLGTIWILEGGSSLLGIPPIAGPSVIGGAPFALLVL